MRENRTYGSEGGDGERRSRPLSRPRHRNREASETRCAQTADASLSDFGTGDVSPSNGDSLQRQLHRQPQPQRSLRGADGNGNCRYAERQGQLQRQRSLRGHSGRIVPAQRRACARAAHSPLKAALKGWINTLRELALKPGDSVSSRSPRTASSSAPGRSAHRHRSPHNRWRRVSADAGPRCSGRSRRTAHSSVQ